MAADLIGLLRSRGLQPVYQAATHGGEHACPCPLCGGRDRFRIWPGQEGGPACSRAGVPGTWYCRQCGRGGDTLQFLLDVEGLDFAEACKALNVEPPARRPGLPPLPRPPVRPAFEPRSPEAPAALWRERAASLVEKARAALPVHPEAQAWLTSRGLPPEAAARFSLGFLEGDPGRMGLIRARSAWGLPPRKKTAQDGTVTLKRSLFLPRGILIPAFDAQGAPLRLRVRRSDEDAAAWGDKYMVVEGSAMPALLAGEDPRAVVVVEAELDALAVAFAAGDLVTACAVLTNAGRPDATAHALLSRALRILVALDFDEAGARGWSWWKATYPQARRWPVPEGKDPGDAVRLGCDLREWILAGLPPALTLGASDSGQRVQEEAGPDTPRDPDDVVIGVDVILSPWVQRLVDRVRELRGILGSGPLRIDKRGRQARLLAPEDWKREHREEYLRAWELVYVVSETVGYIATHPDKVLTGRNF